MSSGWLDSRTYTYRDESVRDSEASLKLGETETPAGPARPGSARPIPPKRVLPCPALILLSKWQVLVSGRLRHVSSPQAIGLVLSLRLVQLEAIYA